MQLTIEIPAPLAGPFGRANTERSMRVKIGEVFGRAGQKGTAITTSDQPPA